MKFHSLKLASWRQFSTVDISFHPHMTILTGANGAGKTTILNILSRHFGWGGQLVGTPRTSTNSLSYSPDAWSRTNRDKLLALLALSDEELDKALEREPPSEDVLLGPETDIGSLQYDSLLEAPLRVPVAVGSTYQISIHNQQAVVGLHIPSHRPIYSYQPVAAIPTTPKRREQVHSEYVNLVRLRYMGQHHQHTPNYLLKETLLGFALFGEGNKYVAKDPAAKRSFLEFQEMLQRILPPSMGFRRLRIKVPEVLLLTKSGEISLDAVSGGIASLTDIAWQIFSFSESASCVVTIDEPENHLHPELQRNVLPNLINAFPDVQFIIATHNPFVIGSVPDSNVYALRYDESNRVYSDYLPTANRAGTANEILREVLGLDSTSPLWVEQQIAQIMRRLSTQPMNEMTVEALRTELMASGLADRLPSILADAIRAKSQ